MSPWRDESGANAVEFALVLPILIVLIFGILFGGLLLNQQLSVTQAAREGARFAATLPVEDSDPDQDWFNTVRERAFRGSAGSLGGDDEMICIWYVSEAGDEFADGQNGARGCPSDPPGQIPADDEGDRVIVYAEQPAVLELVLYEFQTTVRSRAVARHEGGLQGGE